MKCINTILQCNSVFFSYLILPSFRYNELRNFKALSLHNYGSTLLLEMLKSNKRFTTYLSI